MKQAIVFDPEDFQKFLTALKDIVRTEVRGYVIEGPMTAKEAASYLRISEWTLWDRIKKGRLPAQLVHRNAGSVYFFPSELCRYLKES